MSDSPRYYMACLDLRGRDCLVVGGGRVATEKVHGLLDCEANVAVVAPQRRRRASPPAGSDRAARVPRMRTSAGRFLVIAATNDRAVNTSVSADAAARATLCNVADDPELCNFILPAIVRRDPIVVGVSTGGASPALAQRIRGDIADADPARARRARAPPRRAAPVGEARAAELRGRGATTSRQLVEEALG